MPDTINPLRIIENSNNELFLASNHGIFKSYDQGLTWEHTGNLDEYIWEIVISEDDEIYAGYFDLFRSDDDGYTWEIVSQDLSILSLYITT